MDVFDLAGHQKHDRVWGDPHDLTITPGGTRLVVRTHQLVLLYDIGNLPGGLQSDLRQQKKGPALRRSPSVRSVAVGLRQRRSGYLSAGCFICERTPSTSVERESSEMSSS